MSRKTMITRGLAFLCAALSTTLLSGCLAVAAAGIVGGVGYYQYDKNEVSRDFPTGLQETWDATLEALEIQNRGKDATKTLDTTEGLIEGRDLWVRIERHPEEYTRVRVRIGKFKTTDHVRHSNLLLDNIQHKLGVDAIEHIEVDEEVDEGGEAETLE